jgi:hydrogenase maturation protease
MTQSTPMKPTDIIVLGFGNPLMTDDGLGPAAVARLRAHGLPAELEIHDVGTSALDALPDIEGRRLVVIVDAVRGGQQPGTVYQVSLADWQPPPSQATFSLHSLNLHDAVRLWELQLGVLPEIVVFGIEPASTALGLTLSAEVEASVPALCRAVVEAITARLAE